MRSAIGLNLWTGQIAGSARDGQFRAGWRWQSSYEQDFSPAGRGQGPWCERGRGPTLKQTGGGQYRRMEVITMAVVAILIAVGVVALIYLGLFFVVWAAWFAMCSA